MSKNSRTRFTCQTCSDPPRKSDKINPNKLEEKMEELISSVTFMGLQFDDFNKKIGRDLIRNEPSKD